MRTIALDNVNCEIRNGEFVSLVGPSGCGKSSLLKIIDGLESPSSGLISIDDRVNPPPGRDRGFVFQADSLLPWRTIYDNIRVGQQFVGMNSAADQARVTELLSMVGLTRFRDHYPHQLSGGMRQRANLARALCVDPRILLMDEPFGALDAQTRELMQAELLRIWGESNKTVVFVTHSIEEAVYLSDRVLVMSARPGTICGEVIVDLPRPRELEIRHTQEFIEISKHIWELLRDQVTRAFEEEASP